MIGTTVIYFLLLCIVLRETRHGVLFRRRAERLRKEPGNMNLDVPEEMRTQSMRQLLMVCLVRPFHFLFTAPVIIFCAAYNGYLFGLTLLFNGGIYIGIWAHGIRIQYDPGRTGKSRCSCGRSFWAIYTPVARGVLPQKDRRIGRQEYSRGQSTDVYGCSN
jgi:hypothetical protein